MKVGSIITKVLMAISGLVWLGFAAGHMTGNLLLFKGPQTFQAYADMIASTGALLYVVEAALILFLLLHAISGIRHTLRNRAARPQPYQVAKKRETATIASRTMLIGGLLLLLFIPTHVAAFKFGAFSEGEHTSARLYSVVITAFKNPGIVIFYEVVLIFLGLHLSHGFASAFQTLGLLKPSWQRPLKQGGLALGWVIAAGFMILPIWGFFFAKV